MKKKIIKNYSKNLYEINYIISKKKYASYFTNKKTCLKTLSFFKNDINHRPCNLGPQYRNPSFNSYYENNLLHNLYDYAWIDKSSNIKQYWIYGKDYTKDQFSDYLSIYNNLSYKRTY